MKYRRKPIIVDAFKWSGEKWIIDTDQPEFPVWADDALRSERIRLENEGTPEAKIIVKELSETMIGGPGDYVILNKHGQIILCDSGEFEEAFEKVES